MPMSTDVNLPRDHKPIWPDRCVFCRAAQPDNTTRVWTFSIGWWTIALLSFGALFVTRVPACPACARKLRTQRLVRWVTCMLFICVAVIIAIWLLGNYAGPAKKYLVVAIALAGISPYILWEVFFPPRFGMTCFSKSVDYEFEDEMYAIEFQMLNMQPPEEAD